jgi:hypothetical protein
MVVLFGYSIAHIVTGIAEAVNGDVKSVLMCDIGQSA